MALSIVLPDLIFEAKKNRVGSIKQLLSPEMSVNVNKIEQVKIRPRTKADCYFLENGERVIIAQKALLKLPKDVDGVLKLHDDKSLSWVEHRKLTAVSQIVKKVGLKKYASNIAESWIQVFRYQAQGYNEFGEPDSSKPGLRPPQLGALFAIAAHWSLNTQSGTVIMPTGTGKTETMLSVLASQGKSPIIVGVPSKALRKQTVRKFLTFGLLRKLNILPDTVANPLVAILMKQPKDKKDLEIFDNCNVLVSVVAGLTGGIAKPLASEIASKATVLIIDEAHHVAAATWGEFKEAFSKKLILQFTATPFRADGKIVDGEILFSYSLKRAQQDKYFKPIKFLPVHEILDDDADNAIAKAACDCLREDRKQDFDHLIMARCDSIARANLVLDYYDGPRN